MSQNNVSKRLSDFEVNSPGEPCGFQCFLDDVNFHLNLQYILGNLTWIPYAWLDQSR